jgi:hypothetical protein
MSFEEPTQRVRRPEAVEDAPTSAAPGPLNLAGRTDADDSSTTDVLSLDELFDGQPDPAAAEPTAPSTLAEAPTWTAMPVVPVRSEPVRPLDADAAPSQEPSPLGGRVRSDAAAAWDGAVRRTREWLARDDNGLTLTTALVAVILIITVSTLSR